MEVSNAATEKELKEVVVGIEKDYNVSESMRGSPLRPMLIFPSPLEESDHE